MDNDPAAEYFVGFPALNVDPSVDVFVDPEGEAVVLQAV